VGWESWPILLEPTFSPKKQSGPQLCNHTGYPVTQPFGGMWTKSDCCFYAFEGVIPYYACYTCNVWHVGCQSIEFIFKCAGHHDTWIIPWLGVTICQRNHHWYQLAIQKCLQLVLCQYAMHWLPCTLAPTKLQPQESLCCFSSGNQAKTDSVQIINQNEYNLHCKKARMECKVHSSHCKYAQIMSNLNWPPSSFPHLDKSHYLSIVYAFFSCYAIGWITLMRPSTLCAYYLVP